MEGQAECGDATAIVTTPVVHISLTLIIVLERWEEARGAFFVLFRLLVGAWLDWRARWTRRRIVFYSTIIHPHPSHFSSSSLHLRIQFPNPLVIVYHHRQHRNPLHASFLHHTFVIFFSPTQRTQRNDTNTHSYSLIDIVFSLLITITTLFVSVFPYLHDAMRCVFLLYEASLFTFPHPKLETRTGAHPSHLNRVGSQKSELKYCSISVSQCVFIFHFPFLAIDVDVQFPIILLSSFFLRSLIRFLIHIV